MKSLSSKTLALTAMIALGSLMSTTAHAAILHTADGVVVKTKEGCPVYTGEISGSSVICAQVSDESGMSAENVVFFDFNKDTLNKDSKKKLQAFASKIQKGKVVTVVGYADRMGDAAYNEKLALKRAKSVHDFLVKAGVKAKKVEVRSLGKSAPKAECSADLPRAKMISCLAVDRRVEIEVK